MGRSCGGLNEEFDCILLSIRDELADERLASSPFLQTLILARNRLWARARLNGVNCIQLGTGASE